LDGQKKFPERLGHFRILAPRRQQKVNREHGEICRHNAQRAPRKKAAEIDFIAAGEGSEQLPANEVSAKDEKQVYTDPAETIHSTGKFESEKSGVVNDDDNNGKCAEQIETWLALAVLKARVNPGLSPASFQPESGWITHEYSSSMVAESFD
jgi:hypothetical protein